MASTEDGATIWAAGSNGILSRYEDGIGLSSSASARASTRLEYVNGELWLATDRGVLVQRGTTVEAVAKLGTETAHALLLRRMACVGSDRLSDCGALPLTRIP